MHSTQIGREFEKEIADLYRLMGYQVEHDLRLAGQQIDMLASITPNGSGEFTQIIECKFKSDLSSIGNDDIQSIAGAYFIAKAKNLVSGCVLVSNTHFSNAAKDAAVAAGITLKTKSELITELIDFRPYLDNLVKEYVTAFSAGTKSWYLENFIKTEQNDTLKLTGYVDQWLATENKNPLALTGSYGTGKSSFCLFYAARMVIAGANVIPLIIKLRNAQQTINLETLIRDFLDVDCAVSNPRMNIFRKMYEEGKILLFLDGLDEMSPRLDFKTLEMNLTAIEKYSRKGNVILTCRPECLISEDEELKLWIPENNLLSNRLSLYNVLKLQEWDDAQVRDYVQKRLMADNDPERIKLCMDCIQRLPELRDLSTRVVHLELIVKMLPVMIRDNIAINLDNLYRTYIEKELVREVVSNKRLPLISDEERFELMKEIAVGDDLLSGIISFSQAQNIITKRLSIPALEMEAFTRDFLNRSFLTRKGDYYEFAHKSIQEYLIASKIIDEANQKKFLLIANVSNNTVPFMAIEMLGGIGKLDTIFELFDVDRNIDPKELTPDLSKRMLFINNGLLELGRKLQSTGLYQLAYDMCTTAATFRIYKYNDAYLEIQDGGERILNVWTELIERIELLKQYKINSIHGIAVYIQNPQHINLKELLKSCITPYTNYHIEINGGNFRILADKQSLSRVFDNIIANTVRAMGVQGELVINVSKPAAHTGQSILLEFKNNGPAIHPEDLESIFTYGYTTRKKAQGHGLGLYIVKNILKEIGGNIEVSSNEKNTSFFITIPCPIQN